MKVMSPKIFKALADEALEGIIALDPESHQCVYINRMAEDLLEMSSRVEQNPLTFADLVPEETRTKDMAVKLSPELLKHEGVRRDVLLRKCNGRVLPTSLGVKYLGTGDQTYIVLMFQDVSVQKKLQRELTLKQSHIKAAYEELLNQNQQLKDLDIAKDQFIALTTHELRTPLSAMIASTEVLKYGLYDSDEEKTQFVNTIYEQGTHLLELVNDILDFAKIQAGRMEFFIEEQEVFPLIENIFREQQDYAKQSTIQLQLAQPPEKVRAYFDSHRLRQVINNVLSNAIKYNRKGGSVRIWLEATQSAANVFIQDTGLGIPADRLKDIFNEFETLGKVSEHHKGTGLGMPISKRLIECMGGEINLESEVGKGTTFVVRIPRTRVLTEDVYRSRDEADIDLAAS